MDKASRVKNENFIVISGWMINELHLKGNELQIYAIIYGFSQAESQCYSGGLQYLADWTNSTKQGVIKCLKSLVDKKYITKTEKEFNRVKYCEYRCCEFNSIKQSLIPIKQSLTGGIKHSLPNNIVIDNIDIEKEKETNKEKTPIETSFDVFIKIYHETCINFPKVKIANAKRKKAVEKFLKQFTEENFRTICQKANASDFLAGRSTNFRADFDFLLVEKNAVKILEGGHDNSPTKQQDKPQRQNKFANFEQRKYDFAAIEKALTEDEPNDGITTNFKPEPKPQQGNSLADMMRKDSAKTKFTGGTWL